MSSTDYQKTYLTGIPSETVLGHGDFSITYELDALGNTFTSVSEESYLFGNDSIFTLTNISMDLNNDRRLILEMTVEIESNTLSPQASLIF